MIRTEFLKKIAAIPRSVTFNRNSSSNSQINIKKLEEESTVIETVYDEDIKLKEEQIELSRNKSRLREADRSILHNQNPYPEPRFWHHGTLKYLRRTYGRYGSASGVNPSICWPTKDELNDIKEYERIKDPLTISQILSDATKNRKEKEIRVMARQEEIMKKMLKLEQWKREMYDRIEKKEKEAKVAKERKEKLIEEVKKHFGHSVDSRDEKFQEMLEKKEKEQRKAMKEIRRKDREEQMLKKMKEKSEGKTTDKEKGSEEEKEK